MPRLKASDSCGSLGRRLKLTRLSFSSPYARTPMMHGQEKSDPAIVARKPANKAEQLSAEQSAAQPTAAEPVERRAGIKGNADQQSTCRAQSRVSVSQALDRIRKV